MDKRAFIQSLLLVPAGVLAPRWALAEERGVALAVVVAKDSPLKALSLGDLRRVFMGEPFSDPSGTRVVPLNHPPKTPDRIAFDSLILGMNADTIGKFWLDRRIRGQSGAPRTVDSLGLLLKSVARLPGAIGYIRPSFVGSDVTALKVEGGMPGKPGYRLIFPGERGRRTD